MSLLHLPVPFHNILVISPIYNKINKIQEIKKMSSEYDWIIFNDGITQPNDSRENIIQRMSIIDELIACNKAIYNIGNLDYLTRYQLDILNSQDLYIDRWLKDKPNLTVVNFDNSYQLLITSGGIPNHCQTIDQLVSNGTESSFTIHPHETYSGGLGYVISNQPYTKWVPKYYRYSVQIGNTIDGQVYALKINKYGIQRTLIV